MRSEINIRPAQGGTWFRVSAIISEIGPMPTDAELDDSDSSNWHVDKHRDVCDAPFSCAFMKGTKSIKKETMLLKYGAYHGQRIKALAILNDAFDDFFAHPIARDEVVEITLVCNDNKYNIWQVEGIETVHESENGIPPYFRHFMDWQGKYLPCQCPECSAVLKEVCYHPMMGCYCRKCSLDEVIIRRVPPKGIFTGRKIRPAKMLSGADVLKSSVVTDTETNGNSSDESEMSI